MMKFAINTQLFKNAKKIRYMYYYILKNVFKPLIETITNKYADE